MDGQAGGDEGPRPTSEGADSEAAGALAAQTVDGLTGEMALLRVTLRGLAVSGQVKIMLRAVDALSRTVGTQQRLGARDGGLEEMLGAVAAEILDSHVE